MKANRITSRRMFVVSLAACAAPMGCGESRNEISARQEARPSEARPYDARTYDARTYEARPYEARPYEARTHEQQMATPPPVYTAAEGAVAAPARASQSRDAEPARQDMNMASLSGQRDAVTLSMTTAPPLQPAEFATPVQDDEFWVAGNWRGESGSYVWQAGRVERHRAGVLYHPASWGVSSGTWDYTPEYWQ